MNIVFIGFFVCLLVLVIMSDIQVKYLYNALIKEAPSGPSLEEIDNLYWYINRLRVRYEQSKDESILDKLLNIDCDKSYLHTKILICSRECTYKDVPIQIKCEKPSLYKTHSELFTPMFKNIYNTMQNAADLIKNKENANFDIIIYMEKKEDFVCIFSLGTYDADSNQAHYDIKVIDDSSDITSKDLLHTKDYSKLKVLDRLHKKIEQKKIASFKLYTIEDL